MPPIAHPRRRVTIGISAVLPVVWLVSFILYSSFHIRTEQRAALLKASFPIPINGERRAILGNRVRVALRKVGKAQKVVCTVLSRLLAASAAPKFSRVSLSFV